MIDFKTKLNPVYEDLKDMRQDHELARTKDYILEEASSKHRVNLVQKKGMEYRVESYKEELRAIEYMKSVGLIGECKTKEEMADALAQFRQMTSKHPERDVGAAKAKLLVGKTKVNESETESVDDQLDTGITTPAKAVNVDQQSNKNEASNPEE